MCGCPIGTNWKIPTRLLLLGCDHNVALHSELMTPESIEAFLCTEAFEWARRKGNPRTCLQSLQVFKLRYAELLADFGYVNSAREYVVSIRQLTGIGMDDSANSQAIAISGNAMIPVYPDEFIERLYRFEDRLCVLIGAELSSKKKSGHRKSTLASITASLDNVFVHGKEDTNRKDLQPHDAKLDEPSSVNEFMDLTETKLSAVSTTNTSDHDKSRNSSGSIGAATLPPKSNSSPKPSFSEMKPQQFTPFDVSKLASEERHDSQLIDHKQNGVFPPASAPPSLGDDTIDTITEHKPKELAAKTPSPAPSSKQPDKTAPSSEPAGTYIAISYY